MSKSYTSVFIKYAMCAFGLSLFFVALTVFAQANPQINYQGKLTDSTGVAVANGSYDMEFRLYTAASGGSAIWTETLVGANQVPVVNGLFSVMLGSTTAFTSVDFDQTLYLGVNIDSDGEMTPRKILGTVPAAFVAQTANDSVLLDGIASSSFLRSDQADVMTATESSTLLTINQSGTGDILSLLDSGTKVFTVTDGGNVGIGTSSPASMLHVAGASPDLTLQNTALGGEKWTFEANTPGLRLQRDGAGVVLFEDDGNTNFFRPDGLSSSLYIRQNGNIGLSTTSPLYTLTVDGDALFAAGIYDNNYTRGTNGQVLQTTGSGLEWVATSTLGIGGASTFLSLTDSQSSFTANRITFTNSGATALTDSADLTFDGDILSVGGQLNLATTSHVLITQNGTPILHNDSGAGNFGLTDNVFSFNTTGYDLTAFGSGSLANNTTGFDNTAVGFIALSGNEEGSNNTAIGSSVFYLSTSSSGNTGLGAYAGENLTTGSSNLFLGYRVGDSLTTGSNNILIGYDVEAPNNTGSNQLNIGDAIFGNLSTGNIGIGTTTPSYTLTIEGDTLLTGALYDNAYSAGTNGQILQTTGSGVQWVATSTLGIGGGSAINDLADGFYDATSGSLALGEEAGNEFNDTGLYNVAVGYQAGFESGSTTDSDRITLVGYQAGYRNIGVDNTALGYRSLFSNTGINVTAIGLNSAFSNTANSVTAVGVNAGSGNTGNSLNAFGVNSGISNSGSGVNAFGTNSAFDNVSDHVSAFGHSTLRYIATSTAATVFGYQAGEGDSGGAEVENLTAFGYRAGRSLQTGADNNLFVGFEAGKDVTTGSDNILIGYSAETSSPTASNELNIGNTIFGNLSTGNIGIGTTTPNSRLHIFSETDYANLTLDGDSAGLSIIQNATGNANIQLVTHGGATNQSILVGQKTRGDGDTPTGVLANDNLLRIGAKGHDGVEINAGLGAWIDFKAAEDFAPTALGTDIVFNQRLIGGVVPNETMRLTDGNVGIGTTTPFTKLTVAGDAMFTGGLYDNAYSAGTNGQLLSSTGAGIDWVDANAALSGVLAINDLSDGLYNGTSDSLALGEDAGNAFNAAGLGNIAIGYQAGFESGSTTDSDRITLIGYQAGYENTGADNTAMGYNSLFSNKGDNATAIGVNAAVSNTGGSLTAMGVNAGEGNRGNGLTAMGVNSAFNNTGTALTAVGVNSAYKNVGTGVSAFGHSTLRYISTSTAATVFGYQAGQGDLGGAEVANLTAFGYRAGRSLQTGADNNLFIGFEAGKNVTTGSDNILIGYSAETSSPIASEELNIGNVLFSDLSTGFVGIGTSSPAAGLHIQTQNSPTGRDPSNSADDFLIDQTGNAGMTILSGNSAVGSIYFGDIENASRGRLAYNHSDDDFSLWTNSIERLTIDSSGNIGIGTTTPFTKLTVDGNAMLTGSLYDNAYSAGTVGQLFSSNGSGVEWTDASSALSETLSVDDLTDGIYNVTSDSLALGVSAGNSFNGTGLDNVALGYFAGYESGSTTVSDQITVVGSEAGYQNLGDSLSAFGTVSAYQNIGNSVSAFGRNSAYQNKGDFVSAFGQNSAFENTGSSVSAFGRNSAYQNTSNFVSAFGYNTLRNISTSTAATVFGYQTGRGAVVGAEVANLTAFGYQSGLSLETGADNNIFIGHQAGRNHKTGSDNVLIGYSVEATSPTASHQLNIADAIFGDLITGNIGIGTTTPAQKLQVYGDIRVGNSGTNGCIEDFAGGNIGGTCTSDERLKTNIDPLSSDGRSYIERLVALDPVTYQWNELAADTYKKSQASVVTGLIAQDVEEQFPELVSRNNDGYRQVDFRSLPFYILEALREMWEVVTGNTERVDLLEKENKDLRSRLEAIESQLGTSVSAPTVIGEDPEPVIESEEEGLGVIAEEVDSEPATISASNTDTQAEEDPVVVNMPEEIEGEATTTASVLPETLIEEALSPAESSDEEVVIDENVPEENLVESESEIPVETDEIVEEETV